MRRILRVSSLVGCALALLVVSSANAEPVDDFWGKIDGTTVTIDGAEKEVSWKTGDNYINNVRVVFASSATIHGDWPARDSDSDTNHYDWFGDTAAQSGSITGALGATTDADWEPLVSTTDSVSNNSTPVSDWLGEYGGPVFNTNGDLVAASGTGMLSGLSNAIQYDESGDDQSLGGSCGVWTGTDSEGNPLTVTTRWDEDDADVTLGSDALKQQLGDLNSAGEAGGTGDAMSSDADWLESMILFRNSGSLTDSLGSEVVTESPIERSIYVMSGDVQVVPEPSAVLLWLSCTGLAGLIYWRRRRRG